MLNKGKEPPPLQGQERDLQDDGNGRDELSFVRLRLRLARHASRCWASLIKSLKISFDLKRDWY
jgi:hypothetical protein